MGKCSSWYVHPDKNYPGVVFCIIGIFTTETVGYNISIITYSCTNEAAEGGLVSLYCLKLTMFRTGPTDEFGYQFLATFPRVSLFWSGTGTVRDLRDIYTLKWAIFSELEKAGNSA